MAFADRRLQRSVKIEFGEQTELWEFVPPAGEIALAPAKSSVPSSVSFPSSVSLLLRRSGALPVTHGEA